MSLEARDAFYLVLHTGLVLFNLFGWIPVSTRRLNLATLLLTAASWFVLGLWYGIGYCPLTEWHYQVRDALGDSDLPRSYITFLIDRTLHVRLSDDLADYLTGAAFFLALVGSVFVNVKDGLFGIRPQKGRSTE